MKRQRRLFFLVIATLCAGGIFQINRAMRTRQRAEVALARLVDGRNGVASDNGASLASRASAEGAADPVAFPNGATPSVERPRPDASKLVSAHPEVLSLFERAYRLRFDAEYRTLFDRLALSPERVERFKQRLFQDRVDQLDLRWTAESRGASRDDPAFQALRRQQEETLRMDLQAILGPEGSDALDRWRRVNGVRGFVDELAAGMSLAGTGMTLDQQDQLVQAIAHESARFQKGGSAMPWDANWDAIMAKAPAFLTDAQVAALRENGDQRVRFVWMLPQFYAQHRPGTGSRK